MTPLAQRNPKWANIPLGFSKNTSIGSHGCTITCIAMLAGVTPDYVNERLKAVKGFDNNLVIWTKIPQALPNLVFLRRVKGYNNDDVKNNLPCMVEVDFDGTPNTSDIHWVVFLGNKRMNDPWTGREESTSKYPTRGYAVIKRKSDGIIVSEVKSPEPTPAAPADPIPTVHPEDTSQPVPVPPRADPTPDPVGDSENVSGGDTISADSSDSPSENTIPPTNEEIPTENQEPAHVQPISLINVLKTLWRALIAIFKR